MMKKFLVGVCLHLWNQKPPAHFMHYNVLLFVSVAWKSSTPQFFQFSWHISFLLIKTNSFKWMSERMWRRSRTWAEEKRSTDNRAAVRSVRVKMSECRITGIYTCGSRDTPKSASIPIQNASIVCVATFPFWIIYVWLGCFYSFRRVTYDSDSAFNIARVVWMVFAFCVLPVLRVTY